MSICQKGYYFIRNFTRVKKSFNYATAKTIINSYVVSVLDYCNSLLYGISKRLLSHLEMLQKRAAKAILGKKAVNRNKQFVHSLHTLHWLPLTERIIYKIMSFFFSSNEGKAPIYIQDLLQRYVPNRNLRSGTHIKFIVKRYKFSYGKNQVSNAGARIWNDLPNMLTSLTNYADFRKQLKTYLFLNNV